MLSKFERGKGLWKFNCSLLKEKGYLELVNSIIQEEKQKYAISVYALDYLLNIPDNLVNFTITDGEFLEMLLLRIRGESIKFASFQKRQTCELENKLVNEIAFLEANQYPQDSDTLEDKKKELEKIRDIAIQGTVIRSRAQWLNEGERPSKYFCSLEKYNYAEKTIRCVKLDSGKKITDQKDILKEVQHFYSKLFSAQNNVSLDSDDLESIIVKANFRKLNHLESASLEGELKLEELSQVLLKMKNNKCPGVDGFPAEFFKVFWGKLKYFVLRALNFAYTVEPLLSDPVGRVKIRSDNRKVG